MFCSFQDKIVDDYFVKVDSRFQKFEAFLDQKHWLAGGKNVSYLLSNISEKYLTVSVLLIEIPVMGYVLYMYNTSDKLTSIDVMVKCCLSIIFNSICPQPTICDFHFYEMVDQHMLMKPDHLNKYANIMAFHKRFEDIPQIKAFMESDKYMKRPCNNKWAAWK